MVQSQPRSGSAHMANREVFWKRYQRRDAGQPRRAPEEPRSPKSEPIGPFNTRMQRICVFCGSSDRVDGAYLQAATSMGRVLAGRGLELVYGGGSTGLMGALADAALAEGGRVIGVLPHFFNTPELAHGGLTDLHLVETMHERKALMGELSQGFVALPGGLGTMEELFEVLTWAQIGLHRHPVGMLNVGNYFGPLMRFIDHAYREGFLYAEHRDLVTSAPDPVSLLDAMQSYRPPEGLERWVERGGDGK